ncbi:MAG: Oligopeptide-binding protein OppA [Chlamydiae bacterium]|nr:Oligopeptide-binding protein OppA [Chlamydiota bacterium]
MKKYLCFLLLFCLGCQTTSSKSEQTLRLSINQDPISFDPRQGGDDITSMVLGLLFDGLVKEENGEIKNNLASHIEISENGLIYIFKLKNTFWSNGEKVTAYDFEQSWKRIIDPRFETHYSYMLYTIKNARAANANEKPLNDVGIWALDEHTLKVELEHPAPYFLHQLLRPSFAPVYYKLDQTFPNWTHPKEKRYVSNGAFLLDFYEDNDEVILKKNPYYHEVEKVHLNKIHFAIIDSPTTVFDLFMSKELDWFGYPTSDISQELIDSAKKSYPIHPLNICSVNIVEFNTRVFPFSNAHIRKALTLALNRKKITQSRSINEKIATSFLPPQTQLQKKPYFKDCDSKQALWHLEQGLKELNLKKSDLDHITLGFGSSENNNRTAQILQQQWQKTLGIHIDLHPFEWKVFFDLLGTENVPFGMYTWSSELNDPICNLNLFQYEDNYLNSSGWSDPGYAALLEMSDSCKHIKKRKQMLHLAEKILMDAMPICPLYYKKEIYFKKDNLHGIEISKMGDVNFKYAYFK